MRDVWSEDDRPRDPRKDLELGTYSFVDDRWTKGRLATLDGRLGMMVQIRDRVRYGVLAAALCAAMGLGLLRASGRYRSKHMMALGLGLLLGTYITPAPASPASMWAGLLGVPILVFAIVGSLFGDRDGDLAPGGRRRAHPVGRGPGAAAWLLTIVPPLDGACPSEERRGVGHTVQKLLAALVLGGAGALLGRIGQQPTPAMSPGPKQKASTLAIAPSPSGSSSPTATSVAGVTGVSGVSGIPIDRFTEWEIAATDCAPFEFGTALAVHDDALLVGAPHRYGAVTEGVPTACLYRRDGVESPAWSLLQKITADDPDVAEGFARALSLGADFAAIGAAGHEGGDAPSHDFTRAADGKLTLRALLREPSGEDEVLKEYGAAIASDARHVFVGAHLAGGPKCQGCGAVYVFDRVRGGPPDVVRGTTPDEGFGSALALEGELLVVGAAGYYSNGKSAGAAYVFRREGAALREICRWMGNQPSEEYGGSVAISGARVVVGASGRSAGGRFTVHEVTGDVCALRASFAGPGASVSASGDWIAAGQPWFGDAAIGSGRVGVFHVGPDGTLDHRWWLLPKTVHARSRFGASVVITPTYVAAGAPGGDAGRAFVAGAPL